MRNKILLLVLIGVGCKPVGPILDVEKVYRYDMLVEVDDREYVGAAVLDEKPQYEFKFKWEGRAEILKFTTCHREEVIEFRNDKWVKYTYIPQYVEKSGFCPILVGAYDTKAQHAWALIEIRRPSENMAAFMNCNGRKVEAKGVGVCQGKAGLFQRLAFDQPVSAEALGACGDLKGNKLGEYEFKLEAGTCDYIFSNNKGDIFRLKTVGYDEVLIRKTEFN